MLRGSGLNDVSVDVNFQESENIFFQAEWFIFQKISIAKSLTWEWINTRTTMIQLTGVKWGPQKPNSSFRRL